MRERKLNYPCQSARQWTSKIVLQSSIGKHKYGGGNDKKLILLRAKFQNKGLLSSSRDCLSVCIYNCCRKNIRGECVWTNSICLYVLKSCYDFN